MSEDGSPQGRRLLDELFARVRAERRSALLPYLTAGIPSIEDSVSLFEAMAAAGADGFEVGIPYADPLMDGPVIMRAGELALAGGVTVDTALEVVRRVVETTRKPVLVMTYVNPVLRRGIAAFMAACADAGASGIIIADLSSDESGPYADAASDAGLGLVQFAAPTTGDERLGQLAARDPLFVYAIAEVGVTGERDVASTRIAELSQRIRAVTDAPIVFGVGISTPDQAASAADHGDGVIVGSAVVRRVMEAADTEHAVTSVTELVGELARAIHRE
jgi:tryptophan synthase alpha chain